MATQQEPFDISDTPDLVRLVEEAQRSRKPRVLQRDGKDVAILTPVRRRRRKLVKARPLGPDDSIFNLIGIGESNIPGGVSGKKHEFIAQAYRQHHNSE